MLAGLVWAVILPDDRTVAELALSRQQADGYRRHVQECVRWWGLLAGEHGLDAVLRLLAVVGAARCYHWWLAPWWPARVTELVLRLRVPRRWVGQDVASPLAGVEPPPEAADLDRLRDLLLAGPDRMLADTVAYCLRAGLGVRDLGWRPGLDRDEWTPLVVMLDAHSPAGLRRRIRDAVWERSGQVGA